jgi:hypothetical protein
MAFNTIINDIIPANQQQECVLPKNGGYLAYDQFILFGDSITQGSANQDEGFGLFPALAHGIVIFFLP